MTKSEDHFSFAISLSVLNHLGRNLYRSFITVVGEAISNAWDADAENVWIYIDKEHSVLVIKDDGNGMTADDFQNKFLKIGYTKRKDGHKSSSKARPYIGRKGIGKLALLSCAKRITVLTKTVDGHYVGGVIDNSGLDAAITGDLTPDQYELEAVFPQSFGLYTEGHKKGTIIVFEGINNGIKTSIEHLRKLLALYFRFSLLDSSFVITVDEVPISLGDLDELIRTTQFVWIINGLKDPFLTTRLLKSENLKEHSPIALEFAVKGFIASVEKPKDLKVIGTDEKISVDLFVNGRLREKDILKHIPTARIAENYLYGQIHFDSLDDEADRFTSSREGIVADDEKFKEFLPHLQTVLAQVIDDWDKWRIKHGKDGDSDNPRLSKKERKSRELFGAVSEEFSPAADSPNKKQVKEWVRALAADAQFNFTSYAECFISENLLRKFIRTNAIPLSGEAPAEVARLRKREVQSKAAGNLNIDLRQNDDDLSYLEMADLAWLADPQAGTPNALHVDAKQYKPIRDALAHTALLTDTAKLKLTTVYENMKGRVINLLASPSPQKPLPTKKVTVRLKKHARKGSRTKRIPT